MRKGFLLLCILVALFSCAREEDLQTEDLLPGRWKLGWVTGGITGKGYTPAFNLLRFTDASHYELWQNDVFQSGGTYSLYVKEGEDWVRFQTENGSAQPLEDGDKKVQVDRSHLILSDPCCDRYEYHFNKEG
jgi:hypothetical protein